MQEANMVADSSRITESKPEFAQGKDAKHRGKHIQDNPYRAGSQASADWLEGFTYDEPEQNVDRPEPGEG
jgi:hypothetical protein